MLDARRQSVLIAALAGLGAGALSWLVLGSSNLNQRLDTLESLVPAAPTGPRPTVATAVQAGAAARARPLFQRPAPAGPPASVRLEGVSVRIGSGRALIAIGSGPSQWLDQGETTAGVTLAQVRSGGVVIDTADGQATLLLGQTWSATGAASPSAP